MELLTTTKIKNMFETSKGRKYINLYVNNENYMAFPICSDFDESILSKVSDGDRVSVTFDYIKYYDKVKKSYQGFFAISQIKKGDK